MKPERLTWIVNAIQEWKLWRWKRSYAKDGNFNTERRINKIYFLVIRSDILEAKSDKHSVIPDLNKLANSKYEKDICNIVIIVMVNFRDIP